MIDEEYKEFEQFLAELNEAEDEKIEQEADYWINQYKEDKF